MKDDKKRTFIKLTLAGAGAAALGTVAYMNRDKLNLLDRQYLAQAQTNYSDVPDDPNRHWGFMIDLSKCDGCENLEPFEGDPTGEKPRCTAACRLSHHYMYADPPQYWINVYELKENPIGSPFFFPKPCQNCQDAPCQRVCPTGATFSRQDGTVLINHDICIGCRICMAACPYETRFFWYNDPAEDNATVPEDMVYSPEFPVPHTHGTVIKCDLCIHKVYKGQLPHCVTACPQGAIYFGDINEDAMANGREIVPLKQSLDQFGGYRYKEEEGTETSCFYLPPHLEAASGDSSTLQVRISGRGDTKTVKIEAFHDSGDPIKYGVVRIFRESAFGKACIAEGATDIHGEFVTDLNLLNTDSIEVILQESQTSVGKKVVQYVK
ncbi:MAG: 4Fe-4S dicluster domain-containing protein [Candidatus Kariarchaeaceae archaeon]|jgi:molybdopterin-containing oxidoreductase family iron-sulfur binding subunit